MKALSGSGGLSVETSSSLRQAEIVSYHPKAPFASAEAQLIRLAGACCTHIPWLLVELPGQLLAPDLPSGELAGVFGWSCLSLLTRIRIPLLPFYRLGSAVACGTHVGAVVDSSALVDIATLPKVGVCLCAQYCHTCL